MAQDAQPQPVDTLYQTYDRTLYKTDPDEATNELISSLGSSGSADNSSAVETSASDVGSGVSTATTPQSTGSLQSGKTTFDNSVPGYILGFDPVDGRAKFYIGNSTNYVNWDGTTLTIVGGLTATSGTIGGWTITPGSFTSGNVILSSANQQLLFGAATTSTSGTGIFIGLESTLYKFRIGDPTTNYILWSGTALTIAGSIINNLATGSDISLTNWQFTATFSAVNYQTIAWTGGVLTLSNGITFTITGATLTPITTTTYIYFDSTASTSALQTTTTASSAVGANKILIAVANVNADTAKLAPFQAFGGAGGVGPNIVAGNIAASTITANEIAANTITAAKLSTSLLYAGEIILDVNGDIRGGQTGFDTGVGFFLGYAAGVYKFSIGDQSGDKLTWDGTNLRIVGNVQISSVFNLATYTVANLPLPLVVNGPHAPTAFV